MSQKRKMHLSVDSELVINGNIICYPKWVCSLKYVTTDKAKVTCLNCLRILNIKNMEQMSIFGGDQKIRAEIGKALVVNIKGLVAKRVGNKNDSTGTFLQFGVVVYDLKVLEFTNVVFKLTEDAECYHISQQGMCFSPFSDETVEEVKNIEGIDIQISELQETVDSLVSDLQKIDYSKIP